MLHSTAVVENDQFSPKPPSYSSLFSALHYSVLFDHPQFGLPIIKHIPKSVKPSCNAYLSTLLSQLYATPDNISHWKVFLNFAPSFYSNHEDMENVKICRQSSRNALETRKLRNHLQTLKVMITFISTGLQKPVHWRL